MNELHLVPIMTPGKSSLQAVELQAIKSKDQILDRVCRYICLYTSTLSQCPTYL